MSTTPWVSAYIRADFSVSIVIAEAGLSLTGYIMKFRFPSKVTAIARQLPLEIK